MAWCVARTSNSSGFMDPMVYDRILVNEGNAWKPGINKVVIPYTGYYMVHYGMGVHAGTGVYQQLSSDGITVTILFRVNTVHNGVDTMSKTIVRRFTAGNVLKIYNYGYNTFSNTNMQTSFMGLLLY